MSRPRRLLLLPALLLAACGQMPTSVPGATPPETGSPGATAPGTPDQQALPGVFWIDFDGVGTDTPTSQVQSLLPDGLGAQALVSAPDQFSFSPVSVQTFAVAATGIRHIRVTYKVTNNTGRTLLNPKFVAVVPQTSTNNSMFTNVRYFDGSDASAVAGKLTLVQGQNFDTATRSAVPDPQANAVLTGLDTSFVNTTGKGIKSLTQTGWWIKQPAATGGATLMAPGDTVRIIFGVNLPMTSAANGGSKKDPFSFSLNVTAVEDLAQVSLTSAVKQWDLTSETFGNYVSFPTRPYTANGMQMTRSLPAYYDIGELNGSVMPKVLCGADTNMSVTNVSTADFPNRWRVQLFSSGAHYLNVYDGTSCPAIGNNRVTSLYWQPVTGVDASVTSIAAGYGHGLALRKDGTIRSWGRNDSGQLGDGTLNGRLLIAPVMDSGGTKDLNGVVDVAAGAYHSLALRVDGTVWSWGQNTSGQLGDGTITNRTLPAAISGLSDIVSIETSAYHNLALRADGTVLSWGRNDSGQLGDNTTTNQTTPVVVSGLSGVAKVSAGNTSSMALQGNGSVLSWGGNFYGQLGDGTTTNRNLPGPVQTSGLTRSISAQQYYSLALRQDGTAWAWGFNGDGQLADGTWISRKVPKQISGLANMVNTAGGEMHGLALDETGTVYSWGSADKGQLGTGITANGAQPSARPITTLSGIKSVTANDDHSLALKSDGTVWSWGKNDTGQLGDGTATLRNAPVAVKGLTEIAQELP